MCGSRAVTPGRSSCGLSVLLRWISLDPMRSEGGEELGEISMSLDRPEGAVGLEYLGSDPAFVHLAVPVALLVARRRPGDRDHRVDGVRIRYERDQALAGPTVVRHPRSGCAVGEVWCVHPEQGVTWETEIGRVGVNDGLRARASSVPCLSA